MIPVATGRRNDSQRQQDQERDRFHGPSFPIDCFCNRRLKQFSCRHILLPRLFRRFCSHFAPPSEKKTLSARYAVYKRRSAPQAPTAAVTNPAVNSDSERIDDRLNRQEKSPSRFLEEISKQETGRSRWISPGCGDDLGSVA